MDQVDVGAHPGLAGGCELLAELGLGARPPPRPRPAPAGQLELDFAA